MHVENGNLNALSIGGRFGIEDVSAQGTLSSADCVKNIDAREHRSAVPSPWAGTWDDRVLS